MAQPLSSVREASQLSLYCKGGQPNQPISEAYPGCSLLAPGSRAKNIDIVGQGCITASGSESHQLLAA
jgi:hypothetical protein